MSPDFVNMMLFVEHGKYFPKKLKIKGKVDSKSLLGYSKYTAREDSRDDNQIEANKGYIAYASRESSRKDDEIKTFTNNGWITTDEQREAFKKDISNYFNKDGNLAWLPITSFKDFFTAEQYGLMNDEDYAAIFSKVLPKFFKQVGLDPNNMVYWFDYHSNKSHPHTHLVFMEKEQTRDKGMFKQKDLNYFKGMVITEANKRCRLINNTASDVDLFKQKDILKKDLKTNITDKIKARFDKDIDRDITSLYNQIDDKVITGRLQYNSYNMKDLKPTLDKIIDKVIEHPDVKEEYKKFESLLDQFDEPTKDAVNDDYTNFKDTEIAKLRVNIANDILKQKKELDSNVVPAGMNNNVKTIQSIVTNHFRDMIIDYDQDIKIKNIKVIGSRVNGNSHEGSDLDILIEYSGDVKEYQLFNTLNDEKLVIDDIEIDINPIRKEESGSIAEFLNRSKAVKPAAASTETTKASVQYKTHSNNAISNALNNLAKSTNNVSEMLKKQAEDEYFNNKEREVTYYHSI